MPIKPSILPKDSALQEYLISQSITEVPVSYSLACGLSVLGALLKRDCWVDQVNWQIFPNLSILLIGPSGVGKDTAIDAAEELLRSVGGVKIASGRTIENIYEQMLKMGDPATIYIPAPEITSFLGSKDYQKSMTQELTDLLSTKKEKDVSLKSQPNAIIKRPTVTMHAGSTEEWLHKAMPDGSMEGGMWPRFLIIAEEYGARSIPLIKSLPKEEVSRAKAAKDICFDKITKTIERYRKRPHEIIVLNEAAELYENWYRNRFKLFSKVVQPYANRSRDQVLRIAMLCSVSRARPYIDGADMQFAIDLMQYVASTIDHVMKPPTMDARVGREILKILPANYKVIMGKLGHAYQRKDLVSAVQYLLASDQMKVNDETKEFTINSSD